MIPVLLSVVVGLIVGGVAGRWLAASQGALLRERSRAHAESQAAEIERLGGEVATQRAAIEGARAAEAAVRERAAGLEARLEAEAAAHDEKVGALLQVGEELKLTFQGLAATALHQNTAQFLDLARMEMTRHKADAVGDLESRRVAVDHLLTPMRESLAQLSSHSHELELKREGAYKAVLAQIAGMQTAQGELRRETGQLVQALRAPRVRGQWGEMQLRRCIEFSGMVEHASFDTQAFVRDEEAGGYRPDLVVRLPNGRCLVVDAKTPLEAFLNAAECDDETVRIRHLRTHAHRVRKHLDELSAKAYWRHFRESPDFVVCFLPSEVLFSAALEHDAALLEHSARSKVILASPTTLITLLKTVAHGWQQSAIVRDAELIRKEALTVHEKLAGMHAALISLGKSLRKAGDSYDDLLAKAEGRGGLFSVTRKLRDLGIGEEELPESRPVAMRPRAMTSEEWPQGLALAASAGEQESSTGPLF